MKKPGGLIKNAAFVFAAMIGTILASGCAHFWKIPDEPLTTEEICARASARATHALGTPGGVDYRSTVDKDRLTAAAFYDQAAVGDPRFSFGYYHQAASIMRRSNGRAGAQAMTVSRPTDPDYWTLRCREAQGLNERGH